LLLLKGRAREQSDGVLPSFLLFLLLIFSLVLYRVVIRMLLFRFTSGWRSVALSNRGDFVEKEGGQVAISEWSTGIFSLESNFVDFYIHCSTGLTRVFVVKSDIHPLLPEPPGSDQLRAPVKTRCGIDQKGYMQQAVTLRSPLVLARCRLPASSAIPSVLLHRVSFPLPP
jgi:hypothetical protein